MAPAVVCSKSIISEADATGIPGQKAEMTTAVKNGSDLDGDEFLPSLDVEPDVDPVAELDGGASTATSTATSILDLPLFLVLMVSLRFYQ